MFRILVPFKSHHKNLQSKAQLSVSSLFGPFSVLQMVLRYYKITFLLQFESLTRNLGSKKLFFFVSTRMCDEIN